MVTAVGATLGCNPPGADNLLFITLDTTRADHLSAYGHEFPTSPQVAQLAASGTTFERAYTHVASTLPSHSTMFTGLLPPTHGVRCNGRYRLPEATRTLAEILDEAGFHTGAVLAAFPLDSRFGLGQGFEFYDDDFAATALATGREPGAGEPSWWLGHTTPDFERSADEVTSRAIEWLDSVDSRWFLFAHYFDAHWPYLEHPDPEGVFESDYDREIAFMDRHVGRLIDHARKRSGRTLIVLAADHGEGLGQHGEALHNRFVYDSTMHVPLIFSLPGTIPKARVLTPVGLVDVFATVLDFLGIAPEAQGPSKDGRSLYTTIKASLEPEARPIYLETLINALEVARGITVQGFLEDGYKYIREVGAKPAYVREELYAPTEDRMEQVDLGVSDPERLSRMQARLNEWSAALERRGAEREPLELSEAEIRKLKSLGYL